MEFNYAQMDIGVQKALFLLSLITDCLILLKYVEMKLCVKMFLIQRITGLLIIQDLLISMEITHAREDIIAKMG